MDDIIQRLNAACVGQPAHISWPHRLLHEAKEEFERLRAELREAEKRVETLNAYPIGERPRSLLRKEEREALWVNGVMTGAEIALARAMDICRPVPGPEPRDWQLHRARIALREFLCDQLQKQNVELLEAEARRRWAEREPAPDETERTATPARKT